MTRRRPPAPKKSSDGWMATFSDLLMLMLTFFVLLLSMSSLDEQQLRELSREGLSNEYTPQKNALAPGAEFLVLTRLEALLQDGQTRGELVDTERIEDLLSQWLDEAGLLEGTWLEVRPEGITIEIDGRLSFEPGSRRLTPEIQWLLRDIAMLLQSASLHGVISTFVTEATDSPWDEQASWDLALGRADGIARFLMARTVPGERLQIMGYGRAAGERERRWIRNSNALQVELLVGPDRSLTRRLTPPN